MAQEEAGVEPAPEAVTTSDPDIPVDHLKLRVQPLTVGELEVEAVGWRDLVKAKVQELVDAQLTSRRADDQEADNAAEAAADGTADAAAVTGAAAAEKDEAVGRLTVLQDEKTKLLQRLEVVLQAFERKGGDPGEFRTYASAVSGVTLDMKDTRATLSAIQGWLTSEDGGIKWGLGILKFLVIMGAFWIVSAILSALVRKAVNRHQGISDLLKRFINKLVRRTIVLVGLIVALSTVGVKVGAMLALLGGGAFIIGFALQDTLGNFAAGLMLLLYRPFDVGDVVEVGGVTGKVDNVSLVNTTITTFDNKVVLVPNKSVWGEVITNATASAERRVDMVFGIGYDDDTEQARTLLEKIVAEHELVLAEPEAVVKLHELADSSVNFICRPWCKTPDYWTVYWDITRRVKADFDANEISIPYPQQDVHLHRAE